MIIFSFILLFLALPTLAEYTCGSKQQIKKSYGVIELLVNCYERRESNLVMVIEYKKGTQIQHGFQMDYDSLWRKRDSSFYVNGKEEGQVLFWDTLGNIVGRSTYRHGKYVGKSESYWAPGRPSVIKNYNQAGKEEGPWQEWWKNGNKKAEFIAKKGQLLSGTEYYPNGNPRLRFNAPYQPKASLFTLKEGETEAWAPDGRPAGKVVKGKGEILVFPADTSKKSYVVHRERYHDSLMVVLEELDSTEVKAWFGGTYKPHRDESKFNTP